MGTVEEARRALEQVLFPGFRYDVLRYGIVGSLEIEGEEAAVTLLPNTAQAEVADELRRRIATALTRVPGIRSVRVTTEEIERGEGRAARQGIPGVGRVIAVSSAKGGVGKSTVAVNLALALAGRGERVGLLDADVYGPSIPTMTGATERPYAVGQRVLPVERLGLFLMSMGFFLDEKSPVIWRGPMVMSLIRQFLEDVDWGELDTLVIDMPPGTGDAALTLAQLVPISGAVIVTTPQEVAVQDVQRGIAMFRQVHVPVLGIVENMSGWVCPECGEREEIFGAGGAGRMAGRFGLEVLASIPLVPEVRAGGDTGEPLVRSAPDHPASAAFRSLADRVCDALDSASPVAGVGTG